VAITEAAPIAKAVRRQGTSGLRGDFANTEQLPVVRQINLAALRKFKLPGIGELENRIVLINLFDRTNLIRPPTGIWGISIRLWTTDIALTVPLPSF
jgi:hypothetical protein